MSSNNTQTAEEAANEYSEKYWGYDNRGCAKLSFRAGAKWKETQLSTRLRELEELQLEKESLKQSECELLSELAELEEENKRLKEELEDIRSPAPDSPFGD